MSFLRTIALTLLALTLLAPSSVRAEDEEEDPAFAVTSAMVCAGFTTGMFAFDLGIVLEQEDAFGPAELRGVSLGLATAGTIGAHVAAFALLSTSLRESPRARTILSGLSLLSTGLSLIGFALPAGWAIFGMPLEGEQAIAVLSPVILGAMGIAGVVIGSVMIGTASDPVEIGMSASPTGATISFTGHF